MWRAQTRFRCSGERLGAIELLAQFVLRLLQYLLAGGRKVLAAPVDVEREHRQRRAVRPSFAARASFARTRRGRDRAHRSRASPAPTSGGPIDAPVADGLAILG